MALPTKKAPPTGRAPVSMSPSSFTQGGLAIDDVDVTVTDAQTCTWDYNGASDVEAPALCLELQPDGVDKTEVQYWSAGKIDDFVPDESGSYLLPVGSKTGINQQSNLGMFLASLVECGLSDDVLADGNLKALIGLKMHVNQTPIKRGGLIRTGKNAARDYTVLLCTNLLAAPGQTVAAPKKAAVSARPTSAPAAAPRAAAPQPTTARTASPSKANGGALAADPAVDDLAQETVIAVLAENGGAITKKDLNPAVFKSLKASDIAPALRNKVVTRCFQDAFLSEMEGITFDGATITLG